MGAGGAKAHETFAVTPATAAVAVTPAAQADIDQAGSPGPVGVSSGGSGQSGPTLLPGGDVAPQTPTTDAPHATLGGLAAGQGLVHPEFLSKQALVAWLNPNVPEETKQKIAAKAQERYEAQLVAGNVSVVASVIAPAGAPEGHWVATPGEVVATQAAFTQALTDHQNNSNKPAEFGALIAAENKLATAYCPQAGSELAAAVAAARAAVDKEALTYGATQWIEGAEKTGLLPEGSPNVLSQPDLVRLARESTPLAEREAIKALIQNRQTQLQQLAQAREALKMFHADSGHVEALSTPEALTGYLDAAKTTLTSYQAVADWDGYGKVATYEPLTAVHLETLEKDFRAGAKKAPISHLRASAVKAGLDQHLAKAGSRAQLQNYLLAPLSSPDGAVTIAHQIEAKLHKKTQAIAMPATASGTAANGPGMTGLAGPGGGVITAGSGKWASGHKSLVAALRHHAASVGDLPPRPPAKDVESWTFQAGPAMNLGGAHTKSVHTAPDGTMWMFKPDSHGGARAAAEAAANQVLHRVGIPTVPVYRRAVNGKAGTVQPLLKGASQLSMDPAHWSQADVDAIVRYHAAAWVVGDHDAKHDNLLRTPNGGLVPIDHGQAFKFYGRDKLSADYHPNSSYGAQPPVWNVLYKAAKDGGLAPGVKVRPAAAAPVVKALESIPDTEYAAILKDTATQGSAHDDIHWRSKIRQRAVTKGIKQPTNADIAQEFITYAIARKNGVRREFSKLFTSLGLNDADILDKVA